MIQRYWSGLGRRFPRASLAGVALVGAATTVGAATLPPGFQETTVFSGLSSPTAVRFSPDGRVFVAEKRGVIKVYASLTATVPTVFADLRTPVYDYWDRGLLGLALDPAFPTRPYVYVLYTLDKNPADPASVVPTWNDACPTPPGPTASGCPALGRLSRLDASTAWPVQASEQVLLEAFPQQAPSHSVGGLAFGADGALYVSTGEGASFTVVDYGQLGGQHGALPGQQVPRNPLGDPPVGRGGVQSPPSAEGGALRSQSVRRPAGAPAVLSGALLRLDPNTGSALPDNPLYASSDGNARRMVAYGLRNPMRFTLRPGTREVYIGDVGWNRTEEIDQLDLAAGSAANFGWPCHEGTAPQPGYEAAGLDSCQGLYNEGSARAPFFAYTHGVPVVAGDSCSTGSSSITGLAFHSAGVYPAPYRGALFFTDWARRCIWAMLPDASGAPDPEQVVTFASGLSGGAVDLEQGPGGHLYYVDHDGGRVVRIRHDTGNRPPEARIAADPTSGRTPLLVQFDGSGSSDPDGDDLTYAWDFDQDGDVDSTAVNPSRTFTSAGQKVVQLTVEDPQGARATAQVTIYADNQAPRAVLNAPAPTLSWKVGDTFAFAGSATDPEESTLPASAFRWLLVMHHCPGQCHIHNLQEWNGVVSGSLTAPDHEYPSWMELRLTVTDAGGLTDTVSVNLHPQTASLTLEAEPSGLQLALGPESLPAPFTRTVIVGSSNSVGAPSPQAANGVAHGFRSWSDGGAPSHLVVAPPGSTIVRATYRPFADLALTASGSPAVEGGRLAVSASLRNAGPNPATAPKIEAEVPAGTSVVSSAPPGACVVSGLQLGCSLADLPSGATVPVNLVLRPSRAGALDLSLVASATQAEPTPADNTSPVNTLVRPTSDLSGDGRAELFWQNATSGSIGLWKTGASGVTGAAALSPDRGPDARWQLGGQGDFDADGQPDLVWRNPDTGSTEIWLMDGLVRRSVAVLAPVGDPAWVVVAAADFDGDGWPDIFWRHRTSGSNYLSLMAGVVPRAGAALPSAPAPWEVVGMADLDADGRPDVVWRRPTDGANAVWLMNGVTATSAAALPSPADPAWRLAAVADLNGDRKADLLFRHQSSGANAAVLMSQLQAVGSAALPTVADLSWKLVGPK